MATVSELIDLINTMYPNGESIKTKVRYMNMAQDDLSPYFGKVCTDETLLTRMYDDEYDLPSCISDIKQIEYFEIENQANQIDKIVAATAMKVGAYTLAAQPETNGRISFLVTSNDGADELGTITVVGTSNDVETTEVVTPLADAKVYTKNVYSAITSITGAGWLIAGTADTIRVGVCSARYDYTKYERSYTDEFIQLEYGYRQGYDSSGNKTLIIHPEPGTSNQNMRIRYRKALTPIDPGNMNAEPEFDSLYHDLLAFYACYMICSTSASPDDFQSDRFIQSYTDGTNKLKKDDAHRRIMHPDKPRYNRLWMGR